MKVTHSRIDHGNGDIYTHLASHTNSNRFWNASSVNVSSQTTSNGRSHINGSIITKSTKEDALQTQTTPRIKSATSTGRAEETAELLKAVEELLIPFIARADKRPLEDSHPEKQSLVIPLPPQELIARLQFVLPEQGSGKKELTDTLETLLKYSVNTWDQGFMHKLYATTNPVGIASELILSVLNTALHVYKVSPALSVIERSTGQKLASAFGLDGSHAGGATHPGGSASNLAALVVARNTMFPDIRHDGNQGRRLVVFTSEHSHYSIKKAAQTCGIGANSVCCVPTDDRGSMRITALVHLVHEARIQGKEPFFVNATAGTTVLGACDPLHEVADLCQREGLWMHVDASWGGGAVFSDKHRYKLCGSERASSITVNPHKMLGVPITCSFLLAADMRVFWRANKVDAEYLFHNGTEDADEVSWDLADSTLQCGRKGDSLKLALSWIYYGREGLGQYVDRGFDAAEYLADCVRKHPQLVLVSTFPPPCLQVCFYHQPAGPIGVSNQSAEAVTSHTEEVCEALLSQGLMIDHAPGPHGNFFRVVVNGCTTKETLDSIVRGIVTL